MITIINLIKDSGINYQIKGKGIEVKDLYSYLDARKLYEEYKNNTEVIEIVIKKRSLFNFFLDLEEDSSVVVEKKSPKIILGISIDKMKSLGIMDIESFYNISEGDKNFDMDLMKYHFKEEKNIFTLLNILENISFSNSNLLTIFKDKYIKDYPEEMKKMFLKNPKMFKEKLLEGYIFSKYIEINYRIFEIWDDVEESYRFYKNNKLLDNAFLEEFKNLDFNRIEEKLEENYKKLPLFVNYNEDEYLACVSGSLDFEKNFYISKFLKDFNSILDTENKKRSYEKFKEKFSGESLIEKLLDKVENIQNMNVDFECENIEIWKKFFKEKYILLNNDLSSDKIENLLKNCEKKFGVNLDNIRKTIENKWKKIDEQFQDYFMNNYNQLMSSEVREGISYKLEEIKKLLLKGKKVFVVFVDCLRYDVWKIYKEEFNKIGYFIQNDDITLSMIPTVTNHCKKILFSGKKYNNIEENASYLNEIKSFFSSFKVNSVSNLDDIDENADINIYEILEIDENIHKSKDITIEYLKSILHHRMKLIMEYIKYREIDVVVCTDHGCVAIKNENTRSIEFRNFIKEKNLELENHGRYMSVSGLHFDENIYNILMENLKENGLYHVIERNRLKNFYLKETIRNREVYCYIMYKGNYAPVRSGECTHGGITLEEVMIPFAVLEKKIKKYIPIKLEVINSKVTANEKGEITILLLNENKIDELEISLLYNGASNKLNNINGNKQIDIPLIVKDIGTIPEKIVVEMKVYGKIYKQELYIDIDSIESTKIKISRKLKKSRSLL